MTWDAFKTKFHKAHVPSGLIKIMRDKFLNLKQGGMSVTDYLDKFTTWGRYAPNDIDTDEKKREISQRVTGGAADLPCGCSLSRFRSHGRCCHHGRRQEQSCP
jgi:hypothetical protein